MKVSIVIPVYNERVLIVKTVHRTLAAPLPACFDSREVIVVDDGSWDGTSAILREIFAGHPLVRIHDSVINRGKGSAVRVGFRLGSGDVFVIQDGDLEYDPRINFERLLAPFADPGVDIVYGSRFMDRAWPDGMQLPNFVANKVLTYTARALLRVHITDEATGYKAFRRSALTKIPLQAAEFDFCPEVTARASRLGFSIHEVPIRYEGRHLLAGKKIRARDGLKAMWVLVREGLRPISGLLEESRDTPAIPFSLERSGDTVAEGDTHVASLSSDGASFPRPSLPGEASPFLGDTRQEEVAPRTTNPPSPSSALSADNTRS